MVSSVAAAVLLRVATLAIIDPDAHCPLLPLPQNWTNGTTALLVSSNIPLTLSATAQKSEVLVAAAKRIKSIMFAWGASSQPPSTESPTLTAITLDVADPTDSAASLQLGVDESYSLVVGATARATAVLKASTVWGALRALETLSQLVEVAMQKDGGMPSAVAPPRYELRWAPWSIADAPAFMHRGVMIDTARHFLPLETLLRQIDALAFSKLNTLHWHAVDADAFPLDIAAFPYLSRNGAYSPAARYTEDDQKAVVQYARERGVRVIVELDMPGHISAWSLGLNDSLFIDCAKANSGDYNGVTKVLDLASPDALAAMVSVVDDAAKRFPSSHVHLGGDEVDLRCVNASASAQAWILAQGGNATVEDLYVDFERRLHAAVGRRRRRRGDSRRDARYGAEGSQQLRVVTWADVWTAANASGSLSTALPPGAVAQVWGRSPSVSDVAKSGVDVVRSTGYYLSTGFSTGGTDLVWESLYNVDPMPEGLSKAEAAHVLGAEACMWGEVTDQFNIDSKTWLRASVLAERLWTSNATIAANVKVSGGDGCCCYSEVDAGAPSTECLLTRTPPAPASRYSRGQRRTRRHLSARAW